MAITRRPLRTLSEREARIILALAAPLFPRDRLLDVDEDDADVVGYLDRYATALPGPQRQNLTALLLGADAAFSLWAARPNARLGSASPDQVLEFVGWWSAHERYTMRQTWLAVKGLLCFAYADAPAVHAAIGLTQEVAP